MADIRRFLAAPAPAPACDLEPAPTHAPREPPVATPNPAAVRATTQAAAKRRNIIKLPVICAHDFELVDGDKFKCLPCSWALKKKKAGAGDVTFLATKADSFISHYGLKPRVTKRTRDVMYVQLQEV
jgi:hypothetical protein